jgi:antitoxin component YwqK of YwqJK toxin-antitoxin module
MYGILIMSIVTPFFYFYWFKRNWYVSVIFFVISGYYVIRDQNRGAKIQYSFKEKTESVNNNEIRTVREYYSLTPEKIRSESYWKDGRKDSIWTVYAEDGIIIGQKKYRDGAVLETIR